MDHNEILKHVKALYEYNQTSDKLKNELVIAFPELREFEDEDMIRYIGNAITCRESAKYLEEKGIDMIKAHRWLESFKQEWSEVDEKIVTGIINDIQERLEDYPTEQLAERYFKEIKWLKSLKERYGWKPSDGQLHDLKRAIDSFTFEPDYLEELYEDLKKLKGG